MKQLLVVVSLVMAAFSFQVNAATITLVNGHGSFNATHTTAFSDTWDFSVPVNNGTNVTVTGSWVNISRAIKDFTATLDGTLLSGSNTKFMEILLSGTGSRTHQLIVSGSSQGSYGGSIDVAQTPIPAAVWLFGSAIMGLTGMKRRKSA